MADIKQMLSPLQIRRLYSGSLDADYSFDTLESLTEYVTTSPLVYAGQLLYDKSTGVLYKVNTDKTGVDALSESNTNPCIQMTVEEYTNFYNGLVITASQI